MSYETQSSRTENKSSILLSKEENEQVFRFLGHKCQTLATCVAQLFVTEPPNHNAWIRHDFGILCLVKDNNRRSYFFRLYCLQRKLIWEQEVYNYIDYSCPCSYLHTFEGEDSMVAFSFADESEARTLYNVLLEKIESKRQRREQRKSRASMGLTITPEKQTPTPVIVNDKNYYTKGVQKQNLKVNKGKKDKESTRRLTKADIGQPQDFRHVTHVGWDSKKGFEVDNVEDPNLMNFFQKAGVSQSQLNDQDTRDFIYDFINKHGGVDAIMKEEEFKLPQISAPPPVPARIVSSPIPPQNQVRTAPPPPPQRNPAPPPPPIRTPAPPKPPAAATASVAPPPPPPPPPMALPSVGVPPPPPAQSNKPEEAAPVPDLRSALMKSIRDGKALKPVQAQADNCVQTPAASDSRGELLEQIRQGRKLNPVSNQTNDKSQQNDIATQNTLAGALARALADRSRAIHSDSDSMSGSEEDDDDEWD